MEKDFWNARWQRGEIGFHARQVNRDLEDAFAALYPDATRPSRALVPLCGKSLDLHWLAARADAVLGVEFVEAAAAAFFDEWGVVPSREAQPSGPLRRHANLGILCADFYAVAPAEAGPADFWYDRAALIALPPKDRARYVAQLARLVAPGARGIAVTIDYAPSLRGGPPFALPDDAFETLFEGAFEATRLWRRPVEDPPRGLEGAAFTSTWRLDRR